MVGNSRDLSSCEYEIMSLELWYVRIFLSIAWVAILYMIKFKWVKNSKYTCEFKLLLCLRPNVV